MPTPPGADTPLEADRPLEASNTIEAEEKRRTAALYSRAAPTYGEIDGLPFAHAGRRLVELAGVGPGDRVLDIGAGRGAVLLPAAERIGPTGFVLGLDFSKAMVEHTRAIIET